MDRSVLSTQQLINEIHELVEKQSPTPEVICFDFFDTLVSRTVYPEDTKIIAAHQLADLLGGCISGTGIYELRRITEKKLCDQSAQNGLDPEFSLKDLALTMEQSLSGLVGPDFQQYSDRFASLLIDVELAVEKNVQQPRTEIVGLLRHCHQSGIKTAIISDFYLTTLIFQELLLFHQIAEYVDYLFVSADHHLTKGHSGKLYEVACKAIGCEAHTMVMVGDNAHADVNMARKSGLTAYCLEASEKNDQ